MPPRNIDPMLNQPMPSRDAPQPVDRQTFMYLPEDGGKAICVVIVGAAPDGDEVYIREASALDSAPARLVKRSALRG